MKQDSIDFMDPQEREYWMNRRQREERAEMGQQDEPPSDYVSVRRADLAELWAYRRLPILNDRPSFIRIRAILGNKRGANET